MESDDTFKKQTEIGPQYSNEPVFTLQCNQCESTVCRRGMSAVLLANAEVQLFSTDCPEICDVATTTNLFLAENCDCWLVNMACINCGNCLGYNVRVPCRDCLSSSNNGHLWMFYVGAVSSYERLNYKGEEVLLWGNLNEDEKKYEQFLKDQDICCR
ncbi:Protein FAM72B,Protein FAM72A [Mytilus coruscus]|uniref:Protein FAM72B,Protein FAM72A n=1 Tax=Mytilus coruscus TaxID=42192 RepID=A0A6J8DFY6_MYTCO|nr:Protein FAM72B,Protein FAM72A [Mytilus coruscus]